ncbi:MAG: 2,3-bisphosphoglycerate-independent phosphoglycerate mutase, partial [Pseudomonadota bacterium]
HMNIGSGRVVMQDLPRIDTAIADGSLAKNPKLLEFVEKLKASGGVCHIMGLLSDGGVHSHQNHIAGLAKILSATGITVLIHAFTDGRDTPPQSALQCSAEFKKELPQAQFASVSGRYYAMDGDKRWDRVSMAYDNMITANGKNYSSIEAAVRQSYQDGKNDEFVLPASIGDYAGMQDGDGLIMANFRADRAREILEVMLKPDFSGFERKKIVNFAAAIGTSEYSTDLNNYIETLFAPEELKNILAEVLANNNKTQLHISETEKYAHVTFFFNGGKEENYPGEERILIPSPNIATYDLQPEMSAFIVTDKLVEAIENDKFDFIVVNFANCDMVGHTGDLQAASKAVEAVDQSVGKLWQAVQEKNGVLLITADHG